MTQLSIKEVARTLSISELTVRRLMTAGKLSYTKIGRSVRVPEEEVRRFTEDCAIKRTQ